MTTSHLQPVTPLRIALQCSLFVTGRCFALCAYLTLFGLGFVLFALVSPTVAAATLVPIYAIQGNGPQTPLYQQWLDTYGVVTGVLVDGFYLQDPQGDADPTTSDGIFVYTRQAPPVSVGQCVQLQRAYVDEFYAKTELSRMKAILPSTYCSTLSVPPPLIASAQLTRDPVAYFERFEGMVVELPALVGIVQGPTNHFADGEVELALLAQSELPYLDGGRVYQADAQAMGALIYLSNALGATLPEARWGDAITVGKPIVDPGAEAAPVRAIIDYNFGKYQLLLWPDTLIAAQRFHSTLPPLDAAHPITADDFTVCTYNVHGLGRGSEQYWDPEEYDRQLAKRARTIAESLQGCTIIGLQETGKPEDAERLAALLSSAFGLDYAVASLPGPNTQSNEFPLTNSLLARRDRVQIVAGDLRQGCSLTDYEIAIIDESCPPGYFPLFNRPPLVVELTVHGAWDGPFPITVIVNHWKSKGGDETVNVVRRTAQAAHVATLVQEKLALNRTANVIVLGDLNDYYASGPVETLRTGTQPPLLHTYDRLPPADRYSYIFNGGSQVLDHILVTPNLEPLLARVDPVHVNADYPTSDNDQVALLQRSSDHDPVLLQIRPIGAGILGGNLGFPQIILTLVSPASASALQSAPAGQAVAETVTDAFGDFRFWALPPGTYDLHIDAPAHFSQSAQTGILKVASGYQTLTVFTLSHADVEEAVALMLLAPALVAQIAEK